MLKVISGKFLVSIDVRCSELDRNFSTIGKFDGRLSNIEHKLNRLQNSIDKSSNTHTTDHETDSILSSPTITDKIHTSLSTSTSESEKHKAQSISRALTPTARSNSVGTDANSIFGNTRLYRSPERLPLHNVNKIATSDGDKEHDLIYFSPAATSDT